MRVTFLVTTLLIAAGCDAIPADDPYRPSVSMDDEVFAFLERYAHARCRVRIECGLPGDANLGRCVRERSRVHRCPLPEASGNFAVDWDIAESCFEALLDLPCEEAYRWDELPECADAKVRGTLGDGECCSAGALSGCSPDFVCDYVTGDVCEKRCRVRQRRCAEGGGPCDPDVSYCPYDGENSSCQPYRPVGTSCEDDIECRFDCIDGTCREERSLAGGPCDGDRHCVGDQLCADGICTVVPTGRAVGEACVDPPSLPRAGDDAGRCQTGLHCNRDGVCVPGLSAGEWCYDAVDPCEYGTNCLINPDELMFCDPVITACDGFSCQRVEPSCDR